MAGIFNIKRKGIAIALLLVLAFALRLYSLSSMDLYFDEVIFYNLTREFVENGTDPWTLQAIQPPFAIWIYSLPMGIFGPSFFSLRIASVLFGTLSVLLVYCLCKMLYDSRHAFLAALIIAVSPLHVVYSRTAFADVIQTFFLLLAIIMAEFSISKPRKSKIVFIILSGMLFSFAYLIKYNALIIFGLYWIFKIFHAFVSKNQSYKRYIYYAVISGLTIFLSSIAIIFITSGMPGVFYLFNSSLAFVFLQYTQSINPYYYYLALLFDALSPLLFILFPVAALFLILYKRKSSNDYFLLFIIISYILIISLQARRFPRYLIMILPFIAILFSRFFFLVKEKVTHKKLYFLIALAVIISLGWSVYEVNKNLNFKLWSEAGEYVKDNFPNASVHGSFHKSRLVQFYIGSKSNHSEMISALKRNDLVIFSWLKNESGIVGNSPWEDNTFFYHKKREEFPADFESYVLKNGALVKSLEYKEMASLWIYRIEKTGSYKKDTQNPYSNINNTFFGMWDIICSEWHKNGIIERLLAGSLSKTQIDAIELKCSKL